MKENDDLMELFEAVNKRLPYIKMIIERNTIEFTVIGESLYSASGDNYIDCGISYLRGLLHGTMFKKNKK